MLLFLKISKQQLLNYRKEFLECLKQNSNLTTIKEFFIFTDEIDHKIENFQNKIKVIYRRNLDDLEILQYTLSKSNHQFIIKSNTFVKILEEITEINRSDLEKYIIESKGIQIFSKKTKISPVNNLLEKEVKYLPIKTSKVNTKIINEDIKTNEVNVKKAKIVDNSVNIKKAKLIKPTDLVREKKLDVIIISVNYNDYLLTSLSYNIKLFENITVVTSEQDILCQNICKKLGVNCLVTDVMFENGSSFNKGKAINFGLNSIDNPDMVLLLDADIIVNQKIDINSLSDYSLYTSSRIMINDYQSLLDFDSGRRDFDYENDKGLGFFQLFCYNNPVIDKEEVYPEFSNDASWSDLTFRDRFTFRECINLEVIHLGEAYQNWEGRITQRFLTNKEFRYILEKNTFNINEYFDNIYCLNLDRRKDRWEKVSKEFQKNEIIVERFSAIDGFDIDDSDFLNYNNKILSESESSIQGILENKNALACLLSHFEILKHAKLNNFKKILIFEDDIQISDSFFKKINLIKDFDWKLIYLGCSQFNKENLEYFKNFYLSKNTLGTFAYGIDLELYDDIIDLHNNNKDKSIDNILSILQNNNYGKCFTFNPNIVSTSSTDSDIRNKKVIIEDYRDEKIEPKLAVITTFFNPNNYINLQYNYLTFSKKIKEKCDLFTIELSFDDKFFIDCENVIRIKGNKKNILWQKERLLNILLESIPKEYTNIAWVDCDIIFENPNWVDEVNENLKKYKILHLYENAKRLNSDGKIGLTSKSIIKRTLEVNHVEDNLSKGIPGFAWAARREVLEKIKFLDTQIIGGADALMFFSFFGKNNTIFHEKMNMNWKSVYLKWFQNSYNEIRNSVSHISGDITHLYHGDTNNRNYNNRYDILNEVGFNPETDLVLDKNNLWKFKNLMLSKKMSEYFESRDEDDNIIDINSYFDKIYVLNLKRRPDRLKNIKSKLNKLKINFERFEAIDGDNIEIDYDFSNFIPGKGMIENRYAYACLLSHFEIIKDAKENNYKRILIFEDDVLISKDIKVHLQKIRNIKDWKLLYLGSSQYDWNVDFIEDFYLSKKSLGTFAYAIDRSIYDDILNFKISKSVDNLLSDIQAKYYGSCFTFYPNICTSDVTESDIRDNRIQEEHSIKMKWNILNYV